MGTRTLETKVACDAIDWKLLTALQENGRVSFSQLALDVGLSAPAVAERVRRLQAAGVIRGYRAEVDLTRLGYTMTAIIRLAVPSGKSCTTLLASLEKIPEVMEAYRITGTESAMIRAAVSSSEHLEDLIDRLTVLGNPTTAIATSSFKRVPAIRGPGTLTFGRKV